MKLESAAVIYVSGKLQESNSSSWLKISKNLEKIEQYLKSLGYKLKKVSILDNTERCIASEIKLNIRLYDVIIILWEYTEINTGKCLSWSLAKITSQELVEFIDLQASFVHNSLWPVSFKVLKSQSCIPPVVYFQRIFIVSVDFLDEQLHSLLDDHLKQYRNEPVFSKVFHVALNGSKEQIDALCSDNLKVTFGTTSDGKCELTLSSDNVNTLVNGEILLRRILPRDSLGSFWVNQMSDLIYKSKEKHVQRSIEVIESCLEDYGVNNIFLSFNGGKDCTVLLHLIQTVLQKKYPDKNGQRRLFCLYVKSNNAFKEQDEFIEQCMIYYNLEVLSLTTNIKEALEITINKKPQMKACFMGSRKTDPFCSHLGAFQMTDPDWPQIMRCSPFLDWNYSDVWDYLLYYKVPYCKLYDYGYTSLGNAANTIRNPSLIYSDDEEEVYLPAYKMLNAKKERSGRNKSKI